MKNFESLKKIYENLSTEIDSLEFSRPVVSVYNPLKYACEGFEKYLRRYSSGKKRNIFLGMNPGPWGMAQTGIPFGEIEAVKNFLCIKDFTVKTPENENPFYPVKGLDCKRSEISGKRLWGFFREKYGTAEKFFAENFVLNYCPLLFLAESETRVRNLTPDKLKKAEREKLFAFCDESFRNAVEVFEPEYVVGIGNFAEERAKISLEGMNLKIIKILHPSPASPQSNKNWPEKILEQLKNSGCM